jgi:hypothetical protein
MRFKQATSFFARQGLNAYGFGSVDGRVTEICSLEEDGLVCDVKRGNFGA